MKKNNNLKSLTPYIFLFVFIIICLILVNGNSKIVKDIQYDEFMNEMNSGQITELAIVRKVRTQTYEIIGKTKEYKENESFKLYIPISDEFMNKIVAGQELYKFELKVNNDPETSSILQALLEYVPIILLGGAMFFLFTRQLGSNGKSFDFGKSKAKLVGKRRSR